MYKKYIPIIVFVISLFALKTNAQEYIVGLSENANSTNTSKSPKLKGYSILELPFVDDFSKDTNIPDSKLWHNSNGVFVNKTFAINPPTIGVATFDPFDSKGKIYGHASSRVFSADTLESNPINLNYPTDNSIYLSFYYQPQGFGDMPERGDSLSLEFYADNKWNPVWSADVNLNDSSIVEKNWMLGTSEVKRKGTLGATFNRVHINISDPKYLKQGFKFRFINYASIAVNSFFPGRSTATDHWHLDFVYLDKDRTESLDLPDIAISKIQSPLSSKYYTVPARHLNNLEAQKDLFSESMKVSVTYTNLGWGTKSVVRNFGIKPIIGTGNSIHISGGSENIFNNETVTFPFYPAGGYEFYAQGDSSAFEIESYLITDRDNTPLRGALRNNDTVRHVQWFKDCYAYDDGTAENGYGLFGAGTANGKVAVEFYNYMADSIRGAYLYFNRAMNDANVKYFSLAVWEDNGSGNPGNLLHSDANAVPVFKDSLNKYVAYKFSKPVFIPKGKFYVGWIQHSEDFLNIGFDRNNNSRIKNFYNISNMWDTSTYAGSLMIRPIFTDTDNKFPSDNEELGEKPDNTDTSQGLQIYPNPIRGGIAYVLDKTDNPVNISKIDIYDLSGVLVETYKNILGTINLEKLNSGVYLMRIWQNGKIKEVKRIVVSK